MDFSIGKNEKRRKKKAKTRPQADSNPSSTGRKESTLPADPFYFVRAGPAKALPEQRLFAASGRPTFVNDNRRQQQQQQRYTWFCIPSLVIYTWFVYHLTRYTWFCISLYTWFCIPSLVIHTGTLFCIPLYIWLI